MLFLICVGDVAACGVSNHAIQTRLLIITLGGGYVAHSYSLANHF